MLGQADLSDVLQALEAVATNEDFPVAVCRNLRHLIPCDITTFNEMAIDSGRVRAAIEPPDRQGEITDKRDIFEALKHQNPLIAHFQSTGDTRSRRISDVADSADFEATDLFRHFYRPLGIRYQLAVTLPTSGDVVVGIAFNKGGDVDFGDRDVEVLDRMRPYLSLLHRQWRAKSEATFVESALRDLGRVTILVEDGRIESMSETDPSGTFRVGSLLPKAVASMLAAEPDEGDALVMSAPGEVTCGGQRWVIQSAWSWSGPRIMIVHRHSEAPESSLTRRETEVLNALTGGGTNRQIATRLGVSEATIRKHLERIFTKINVGDRATAIAYALGHRGDVRG